MKLRDQIEPNEKPAEISVPVVKGVHYTHKASHCVVGVSDFLMTSLAKLTVRVGKGVKEVVEDSEASTRPSPLPPHPLELQCNF